MNHHPPGYRVAFLFALAGLTGVVYIILCKRYKREAMRTFTCGFTGVLFALKAYLNCSQVGSTMLSFPLAGDFYWFSLPVEVPGFAAHFVELFLVSLFFPEEANWFLNLAGVITGHLVYAATTVYKICSSYRLGATDWTREWMLQRIAIVLLLITTYLVYKVIDITKKLEQRYQADKADRQTATRGVPEEVYHDDNGSIPSRQREVETSSFCGEASNDSTSEHASHEKPPITDDEYSLLTDVSKGTQTEIPDHVKEAIDLFASKSVDKDSRRALNTILEMIQNATTHGEQDSKYRCIPLENKRIQQCNIIGAKELILSLGFEIKEDSDNHKYFVYPLQETPEWIPAAIKAINQVLSRDGLEGVCDRESVRNARLKKLTVKKPARRKPRESQFTAGLGGGNSKTIFFHGGT